MRTLAMLSIATLLTACGGGESAPANDAAESNGRGCVACSPNGGSDSDSGSRESTNDSVPSGSGELFPALDGEGQTLPAGWRQIPLDAESAANGFDLADSPAGLFIRSYNERRAFDRMKLWRVTDEGLQRVVDADSGEEVTGKLIVNYTASHRGGALLRYVPAPSLKSLFKNRSGLALIEDHRLRMVKDDQGRTVPLESVPSFESDSLYYHGPLPDEEEWGLWKLNEDGASLAQRGIAMPVSASPTGSGTERVHYRVWRDELYEFYSGDGRSNPNQYLRVMKWSDGKRLLVTNDFPVKMVPTHTLLTVLDGKL